MIALRNAADVARWNLCTGCGACVFACPEDNISLVDFTAIGLRPVLRDQACGGCDDCVRVCPGVEAAHAAPTAEVPVPMPTPTPTAAAPRPLRELAESWGPVLEVWEGHASAPALRFLGSSGGLATALAHFCLAELGMRGVVHIAADDAAPTRNASRFSRTPQELVAATGSKYAPASPCDRLQDIEDADGPCVFMGKPCDVQGLRRAQAMRPALDARVGLAIGIFCAGTPSTQGTLDLLQRHGVAPGAVAEIRFRGRGWPGSFAVRLDARAEAAHQASHPAVHDAEGHGAEGPAALVASGSAANDGPGPWRELAPYAEAWGFLQKYRPYRCHLCPDGTSEFADLSCGDPWYREIASGEKGRSLLLVRTERGRAVVRAAVAAGYLTLAPVSPRVLALSQRELQRKRGAIWGRVWALRAAGVPVPRLRGFSLFRNWLRIPFNHKLRSVVGTLRRALARRYFRPTDLGAAAAAPPGGAHG